jgi:hypothetical protein
MADDDRLLDAKLREGRVEQRRALPASRRSRGRVLCRSRDDRTR